METVDYIVIALLLLVIGGAVAYIIKAKKSDFMILHQIYHCENSYCKPVVRSAGIIIPVKIPIA